MTTHNYCTVPGLSYQGCYRQGKPSTNWGVHHLLTDYTINSQTMTLKECGIICAAGRYPFMGLTVRTI